MMTAAASTTTRLKQQQQHQTELIEIDDEQQKTTPIAMVPSSSSGLTGGDYGNANNNVSCGATSDNCIINETLNDIVFCNNEGEEDEDDIRRNGETTEKEKDKYDLTVHNKNGNGAVSVENWGYPGYLSTEQYVAYRQLADEVERRKRSGDGDFLSTLFCFQGKRCQQPPKVADIESREADDDRDDGSRSSSRSRLSGDDDNGETNCASGGGGDHASYAAGKGERDEYALCRWLRARKFVFEDVVRMVDDACLLKRQHNFCNYDNDNVDDDDDDDDDDCGGDNPLGVVDESVYRTLYPQSFYGYTARGYPIFISQVGNIDIAGIECVTSLRGIIAYHWYDMMVKTKRIFFNSNNNSTNPRYEFVCILDMKGLSSSRHLTPRALNISKVQSDIDSLCFPETLHRLILINVPSFFVWTWRIIRSTFSSIDDRTAHKIRLYSSSGGSGDNNSSGNQKWQNELRSLIGTTDGGGEDNDEASSGAAANSIPVEYGGTGIPFQQYLQEEFIKEYNEKNNNKNALLINEEVRHMSVGGGGGRGSKQQQHDVCVPLETDYVEMTAYTRSVIGGLLHVTSPSGRPVGRGGGTKLCFRRRCCGGDGDSDCGDSSSDNNNAKNKKKKTTKNDDDSGGDAMDENVLPTRIDLSKRNDDDSNNNDDVLILDGKTETGTYRVRMESYCGNSGSGNNMFSTTAPSTIEHFVIVFRTFRRRQKCCLEEDGGHMDGGVGRSTTSSTADEHQRRRKQSPAPPGITKRRTNTNNLIKPTPLARRNLRQITMPSPQPPSSASDQKNENALRRDERQHIDDDTSKEERNPSPTTSTFRSIGNSALCCTGGGGGYSGNTPVAAAAGDDAVVPAPSNCSVAGRSSAGGAFHHDDNDDDDDDIYDYLTSFLTCSSSTAATASTTTTNSTTTSNRS